MAFDVPNAIALRRQMPKYDKATKKRAGRVVGNLVLYGLEAPD